MKRNILLCVDLLTILRHDALPQPGREYTGTLRLRLPSEGCIYNDQYVFAEAPLPTKKARRNPLFYDGRYITFTQRANGKLRPNFRQVEIGEDFDIEDFVLGVCLDLLEGYDSLRR